MNIMKFREFLMQEEVSLPVAHGTIDITDQATMLNINTLLARALDQEFLTPYIALEKVRQVLARFAVHLEGTTKLFDGDEGSFTFAIMQFGGVVDNTADGGVDTDKTRFIYFAWELNEEGTFEVFASLVTSEELEELLDDEDEEDAEDEEPESMLAIDPMPTEVQTEAISPENLQKYKHMIKARQEKCYACDKPIGNIATEVDTRNSQKIYVGSDCFKKIKQAGDKGWQPPKGGPKLYLIK